MKNLIYFDNAATSFMSEGVKKAIVSSPEGNSNSVHSAGREALKIVRKAEEAIKKILGVTGGQIIWTSGGTEANTLLKNLLEIHNIGHTFYISPIEHKSLYQFRKASSCDSPFISSPCGEVGQNLEFNKEISSVSIMLVNNETGVIQPIKNIFSNKAFDHAFKHSDIVQAFGKMELKEIVKRLDAVSISAHKIGGPKGVGCLWLKEKIAPEIARTMNVPGIAGFLQAIKELNIQENQSIVSQLENNFLNLLSLKGCHFKLNFKNNRIPGIMSLQFPGISNEELILKLDNLGVCVSAGSACNKTPSYVLQNLGLSDKSISETIRISLGKNNTIEEIKKAVDIFSMVVH